MQKILKRLLLQFKTADQYGETLLNDDLNDLINPENSPSAAFDTKTTEQKAPLFLSYILISRFQSHPLITSFRFTFAQPFPSLLTGSPLTGLHLAEPR
ncbi:MAG: hypothetical protein RIG62_03190 [Cyclobacteriaceae bacterium]